MKARGNEAAPNIENMLAASEISIRESHLHGLTAIIMSYRNKVTAHVPAGLDEQSLRKLQMLVLARMSLGIEHHPEVASMYTIDPKDPELWQQAANLKLPAHVIVSEMKLKIRELALAAGLDEEEIQWVSAAALTINDDNGNKTQQSGDRTAEEITEEVPQMPALDSTKLSTASPDTEQSEADTEQSETDTEQSEAANSGTTQEGAEEAQIEQETAAQDTEGANSEQDEEASSKRGRKKRSDPKAAELPEEEPPF